jgi:hypothetical protein
MLACRSSNGFVGTVLTPDLSLSIYYYLVAEVHSHPAPLLSLSFFGVQVNIFSSRLNGVMMESQGKHRFVTRKGERNKPSV